MISIRAIIHRMFTRIITKSEHTTKYDDNQLSEVIKILIALEPHIKLHIANTSSVTDVRQRYDGYVMAIDALSDILRERKRERDDAYYNRLFEEKAAEYET